MKTAILTFLAIGITLATFSQTNYNRFDNPHPNIEFVEFKVDGMELKLTKKGIKYVQKNCKSNSMVMAKLVKKLHNKMTGNSSEMSENCIASQIYYHVIFYDLSKPSNSKDPNSKLLRRVEKYVPISKIKKVARKFSNNSANPINANYTELHLRGCKQLNRFVVPPNVFK